MGSLGTLSRVLQTISASRVLLMDTVPLFDVFLESLQGLQGRGTTFTLEGKKGLQLQYKYLCLSYYSAVLSK